MTDVTFLRVEERADVRIFPTILKNETALFVTIIRPSDYEAIWT
jgi:hypothetical protein